MNSMMRNIISNLWPLMKQKFLYIIGVYNYDRVGEAKIRKMYRLYKKGGRLNRYRALRLCNKIRAKYGVIVDPMTKVGKNLYISHCSCIGIGRTAEIGDNCRIYPNVYIAASRPRGAQSGVRRHAKIGNNCSLCVNATILGPVVIGDNVIIGANALVTKDVPSNSVVTGINQIRPLRGEELTFRNE